MEYYLLPKTTDIENAKAVLVCINEGDNETANLQFLEKIMLAYGKDSAQYAVESITAGSEYRLHRSSLAHHFTLLLCDIAPSRMGLQISARHYHPTELGNMIIIQSPSLTSLKDDPAAKKQLWMALKSMMND